MFYVIINDIRRFDMKKLSYKKMADTIIAQRKEQKLTQAQLAEMTGIHRGMMQ